METDGALRTVAIVATALVALVALIAANVARKGPTRAALVAGLLPLALLPALVGLVAASMKTWAIVGNLAATGSAVAQHVASELHAAWWAPRLGFGLTAGLAALGVLGALMRFGGGADLRALSLRRGVVLCLLPLVATTTAGLLTRELQQGLGIVQAVLMTGPGQHEPTRESAATRYLEERGLALRGAGSIAATSARITRALYVATIGGALTIALMLAFALAGLLLAWRVRTEALFAGVSSLVWLVLVILGAAVALGLGAPPSF